MESDDLNVTRYVLPTVVSLVWLRETKPTAVLPRLQAPPSFLSLAVSVCREPVKEATSIRVLLAFSV